MTEIGRIIAGIGIGTNILMAAATAPISAPVSVPEAVSSPKVVETAKPSQPKPSQSGQVAMPAQGAVRDPDAREALALVGADPEAEAYWVEAINDPRLSADERQNLIEDLNEDGLSDPKYPSEETSR